MATQYESLWKEKDKKPYKDYKQNVAIYDPVEDAQEDDDQEEAAEIAVAKMTLDKPYMCQALKPTKVKESIMMRIKDTQRYSFDILNWMKFFISWFATV